MPYKIKKSGNKFQVIGSFKDHANHVYGTHETEGEARAQQKALYANTDIAEATNSAIKKVGDQPVPATQLEPHDNVPSRTVDKDNTPTTDNDVSEFLPSHIDNRELQLGSNIEMKDNPELKANRKGAIRKALAHLSDDPQYYSDLISKGKVNYPEILDMYSKLFKRDTSFMIPHETTLVGMREEIKKILKNRIRRQLSEGSSLSGGNVNNNPETSFTRPGIERTLQNYSWFAEGQWTQTDFPISDNPFGKDSGYRTAKIVQKTAAVPTFNSAETHNFVTNADKKGQVVQKLNKLDIKNDKSAGNDLVKSTKSKIIKLPKMETVMEKDKLKAMIKEEIRKYLNDVATPLSKLLQQVVDGNTSYVGKEKINSATANKMLAIYKLLAPAEQKTFDNGDIDKARRFLKNVEDMIKATK